MRCLYEKLPRIVVTEETRGRNDVVSEVVFGTINAIGREASIALEAR